MKCRKPMAAPNFAASDLFFEMKYRIGIVMSGPRYSSTNSYWIKPLSYSLVWQLRSKILEGELEVLFVDEISYLLSEQ